MEVPPARVLLERVAAIPASAPLLARLADVPGVYLVGGAVRDLLLGRQPAELDLVIEGDAAALARRLGRPRIHDRFGTSTVTRNGFTYDIARARAETYAHPGALPDVRPADIAEDLRRRDFTVNALAIALGGPRAGELIAAPNALEDLAAGRLRVLHAGSFADDPTRLLRLARYASRLGFEIETGTRELAVKAIRSGGLGTVSGPRIGAELRLLAREADPLGGFAQLRELGLDDAVEPGFGLHEPAVARAAIELLPADGRPDLVVLGLAFRGVGQERVDGLLERLAFTAGDRDGILAVVRRAEAVAGALEHARSPSQIAGALRGAAPELAAVAGALGAGEPARAWLRRLRHIELEITGADLIDAGISAGPAVGEGLRAALSAKLDGATAGREDELELALKAARASG